MPEQRDLAAEGWSSSDRDEMAEEQGRRMLEIANAAEPPTDRAAQERDFLRRVANGECYTRTPTEVRVALAALLASAPSEEPEPLREPFGYYIYRSGDGGSFSFREPADLPALRDVTPLYAGAAPAHEDDLRLVWLMDGAEIEGADWVIRIPRDSPDPDETVWQALSHAMGNRGAGAAPAEREVGEAFHRLTVQQRDNAWREVEFLKEQEKLLRRDIERLQVELTTRADMLRGDFWFWQGDGEDHLESLVCPVVIRPDELAKLISPAPSAHAEPTRWNVEGTPGGFRLCRGLHERSAACEWEYYVPAGREGREVRRILSAVYLNGVQAGVEIAADKATRCSHEYNAMMCHRAAIDFESREYLSSPNAWGEGPLHDALEALTREQGERPQHGGRPMTMREIMESEG